MDKPPKICSPGVWIASIKNGKKLFSELRDQKRQSDSIDLSLQRSRDLDGLNVTSGRMVRLDKQLVVWDQWGNLKIKETDCFFDELNFPKKDLKITADCPPAQFILAVRKEVSSTELQKLSIALNRIKAAGDLTKVSLSRLDECCAIVADVAEAIRGKDFSD